MVVYVFDGFGNVTRKFVGQKDKLALAKAFEEFARS